jgi:hypothetical protein
MFILLNRKHSGRNRGSHVEVKLGPYEYRLK